MSSLLWGRSYRRRGLSEGVDSPTPYMVPSRDPFMGRTGTPYMVPSRDPFMGRTGTPFMGHRCDP